MNFNKTLIATTLLAIASASAFAAPKNSTVMLNVSAEVPDPGFNFFVKGMKPTDILKLDYNKDKKRFSERYLKLGFEGIADTTNDLKATLTKSTLQNGTTGHTFDLLVSVVNNFAGKGKVEPLVGAPKTVVAATADAPDEYQMLELKIAQPDEADMRDKLTIGEYSGVVQVVFEAGV